MPDPGVEQWRLNGSAHLWRYVNPDRRLRGWHFNADEPACASIVDLVDRMLASTWKASKRIPISVPGAMTVNPGVEWIPAPALTLQYPRGEVEDIFWSLTTDSEGVHITVGHSMLLLFQKSVAGLPAWNDDFAIGPSVDLRTADGQEAWNDMCLWFWTKIS